MTRSHKITSVLLASTAALVLSGVTATADQQSIETVVVTAQKTKESEQKVPISIKVVSGAMLDEMNADSADDYLRLVPDVAMSNIGRGGSQIQIRGLGSDVGNVGTIVIYNDGVVAPNVNQASGTYSEQDPALYDIDRVEVLRGPQGTLYGEDSLGGVISIVSRRPVLDQYEASFSGSWFDRAHGSADNYDLAGMVNIPIDNGVLAVRIVGFDDRHDGWIDSVDAYPAVYNELLGYPQLGTSAALLKKNANTEDVYGGRIMATYKPNERFDATLIYKLEIQSLGAPPVVSPQYTPYINGFAGTNYSPYYTQESLFTTTSQSKTSQAILEVNYDLGFAHLTSVTGVGVTTGPTVQNVPESSLISTTGSHAQDEELRLASDPDQALSWIVGGYYRGNFEKQGTGPCATCAPTPFSNDVESELAVFGQAYWRFAPDWTATVGLRYANQTSDVTQYVPLVLSTKGNFNSLIPKFTLNYQADEHSLYYATISEGYRAGGANIDVSEGTDPNFNGPFRPDTIWNYELGAKKTFWDNLTINAAVFYMEWNDVQTDHPIINVIDPPTSFIVTNGKNAHSAGVEADVYFTPTPDWTITAGGSLLDAGFDNGTITGILGPVPLKGQTFAGTPKYTASASVEKRFALTDALSGYVRADYSLRGNSYGDVPNKQYVPFGGTVASGQSQIVNLRAGLVKDFWEVQVFSTNLFDSHQNTFTFSYEGYVDEVGVLPPRTIGVNIKLHTD